MRCIAFSPQFLHPAPMLAKQIGANIKAAREAKRPKLSLEKLAAKIQPKTSYQQLSRLEKGDRALTVEWIERIAKALEVDPMSLIAPEYKERQERAGFTLDEQVANEVARTLAVVALDGDEPENGTVQVIALMLQELTATFSEHPAVASDVQLARPLLTLAGKRFAPAAS